MTRIKISDAAIFEGWFLVEISPHSMCFCTASCGQPSVKASVQNSTTILYVNSMIKLLSSRSLSAQSVIYSNDNSGIDDIHESFTVNTFVASECQSDNYIQ